MKQKDKNRNNIETIPTNCSDCSYILKNIINNSYCGHPKIWLYRKKVDDFIKKNIIPSYCPLLKKET